MPTFVGDIYTSSSSDDSGSSSDSDDDLDSTDQWASLVYDTYV